MTDHLHSRTFQSRGFRAALVAISIAALPLISLTATAAPDGVSLQVEKGPGEGDITLNWTGGEPNFDIYRAPSPVGVLAPEYLVSSTSGQTFITEVGAETIAFFLVKPLCVADPPERCDGIDNDCNGVVDDPGAESSCAIANGSAACVLGGCAIGSCDSGYSDLNANSADGCEFTCESFDIPDDGFLDTNCDGVDGEIADAVFVSPTGNDADPGTMEFPVQSIALALALASGSGKTQIYLDEGLYAETVQLVSGISLFGGYSRNNGWARSGGYVPVVRSNTEAGHVLGVYGVDITLPTTLDLIWIQTLNAGPGKNNYALHCVNCPAIAIKNSKLQAGHGGDGADGAAGAPGAAGTNGQQGSAPGPGPEGAGGGAPGTTPCGLSGGIGGDGGPYAGAGQAGGWGAPSTPGGSGGGGSAGCTSHPWNIPPGGPGQNGTHGSAGIQGPNGAGAEGGHGAGVVAGHWVGYGGSVGYAGAPGNGGGGGGGGGGIYCQFSCGSIRGYGGSGGGSGGCPGLPGEGGLAGGGSFGAFFVDSVGFIIVNTAVSSRDGGHGGAGGIGGSGGAAGLGAPTTGTVNGCVGTGGAGGNGGHGGRGGYGGGGGGGVSFAVYQSASSGTIDGCTLSAGAGGAGGTSFGSDGGAGASGTICP